MKNITFEHNQKRKAQRVETPLSLIYNGVSYKTLDWSISGISILTAEDIPFEKEKTYSIQLAIPMGDSSIVLPLTVLCRNIVENKKIGFEFVELTLSNKRILRHYIGLYIDGKLENIEDIIGDLSSLQVESPINEAIMLSDEEHSKLKKLLSYKTYLYFGLGITLLIGALLLIIYNSTINYSGRGVSIGNSISYKSPVSGIIVDNFILEGQQLKDKELLFTVKDTTSKNNSGFGFGLKATNEDEINEYNRKIKEKELRSLLLIKKKYIADQKDLEILYSNNFENAKSLYKDRLVTINDLNLAKIRYVSLSKQFPLQSSILRLKTEIELLKIKKKSIVVSGGNHEEFQKIIAHSDGFSKFVFKNKGDIVDFGQTVIVEETNDPSYGIVRVRRQDSIDFNINQKVYIYSVSLNKTIEGYISDLSYSSDNLESRLQADSNQVLLRINYVNKDSLPLDSRIKVWIVNDNSLFLPAFNLLLFGM